MTRTRIWPRRSDDDDAYPDSPTRCRLRPLPITWTRGWLAHAVEGVTQGDPVGECIELLGLPSRRCAKCPVCGGHTLIMRSSYEDDSCAWGRCLHGCDSVDIGAAITGLLLRT